MSNKLSIYIASLIAACSVTSGQTPSTDSSEKALWQLWKLQTEKPDDHAAVLAAYGEFEKQNPNDPLLIVMNGFVAWHLLKSEKTDEAERIFTEMLTERSIPLDKAAANIARSWLTRIDREKVKEALQQYYRKNVEYPPNLEPLAALPKEIRPPLTDRFGKTWSYSLIGYKHLKVPGNQKYQLESVKLGRTSDLAKKLCTPYESGIHLKPVRMISSTPGRETVQFDEELQSEADKTKTAPKASKQKKIMLTVDTEVDGVFFAHAGKNILILSDNNYWAILPRPR